ncbi:MAG: alpha/beta fold hydrolase [Leptospira sp.]|nr:alpha/beta fold hydrolase [Leptospira sp.]
MKKNIFVVPLFIFLISYNSPMAKEEANGPRAPIESNVGSNVPLVFIHGIKGSVLVNETRDILWINAWQALGFNSNSIALPASWSGSTQKTDQIYAKGILSEVTIIPKVLEDKVYGPWLKAASGFKNRPFFPFAYDWRRDNSETAKKFEEFLDSIKKSYPASKIQVVGHSMGGLITLSVLNKRPQLFHSVVFVGVPFAGGIGFLPDMHDGVPTGLNKKILSPEVLFTFPSTYSLYPISSNSTALDSSLKTIQMDYYSPVDWEKNSLGIFSKQMTVEEKTKAFNFLDIALRNAKNFRMSLAPRKQEYPPVLVINARNYPTLAKIVKGQTANSIKWDFDSYPKEPGDKRVLEKDSFPPKGIHFETFSSLFEHSEILNDPKVIEKIRKFQE